MNHFGMSEAGGPVTSPAIAFVPLRAVLAAAPALFYAWLAVLLAAISVTRPIRPTHLDILGGRA
jgi:hypothetical protein